MRERLRQARIEKNKTQKEVANAIGISVVGYRQIESGKRVGSISNWDKLEDYFNINQRELREIS